LSLVAGAAPSRISADPVGNHVRLVVVEQVTPHLEAHVPPDGSEQTLVLAPSPGESPLVLSTRAIRRMMALEQSKRTIRSVIMILAHRFDREAMNARLLLARRLTAHAAPRRTCSELVLCADDERRPGFRTGLLRLVEALMAQPGSDALAIRIRFASESAQPWANHVGSKKRISQRFFSVALNGAIRGAHS
jgi:hypothetical protein